MTRINLRIFIALLATCLVIPSAWSTPDIQHWQTGNGARVFFVDAPELPMVDVRVIFDGGGARDGDKHGVALMTNGLLEEGTGKLDADAIAERFDSVGASFGTSSHRDMTVVSLRSLTDPKLLDPAVKLMSDILTRPSFPETSLERERKRLLIALQGEKQSPGAIASRTFMEAVYGDHPYAADPKGTEETIKALTRDDLLKHYKRYYVGRNAVVAIVGAVDKKEAKNLAEQIVGKLPAGEPAPALPEVKDLKKAARINKEFPSTQTHILVGQPGFRRGDADHFPLYVGNHVLGGGGLVSLLTDEIREKRGLSYSTYSFFSPMRQRGPFELGLQTRNDKADEALTLLFDTLNKFIKEGPDPKALDEAKRNLTGGFALNLDSNGKIVETLAMIGFYDLPLDYLDTFIGKVNAVTADQVKDAFQRRVHPDTMVTVVVGPGDGKS